MHQPCVAPVCCCITTRLLGHVPNECRGALQTAEFQLVIRYLLETHKRDYATEPAHSTEPDHATEPDHDSDSVMDVD